MTYRQLPMPLLILWTSAPTRRGNTWRCEDGRGTLGDTPKIHQLKSIILRYRSPSSTTYEFPMISDEFPVDYLTHVFFCQTFRGFKFKSSTSQPNSSINSAALDINRRHLSTPNPWQKKKRGIRTFSLLFRPAIVCVWLLDKNVCFISMFFRPFVSEYASSFKC